MYRRKRKQRYIWLPNRYAEWTDASATPTNVHSGSIPVGGGNDPYLQIVPILLDSNVEDTDVEVTDPTNVTIADIVQSNEYYIKRICGNFWCAMRADDGSGSATPPFAALVSMGLFISRVDSSNHMLPAGATAGAFGNFDPQHPDTAREPWIFIRHWILGNSNNYTVHGAIWSSSYARANPNNWVSDNRTTGSGIDQKTSRRVSSDERLFMALSCRNWPPGNVNTQTYDGNVDFSYQFRVLGALRKAKNSGRF